MVSAPDLGYDPATLLGPLDMELVMHFQKWLQQGGRPIRFDSSYLRHLSLYHGGTPKKRLFRTSTGIEYVIERFLNFVDHKREPVLGWYNVNVVWTQIEARLNDYLVPFAALFGGDYLCFDYEHGGRPSIVVWLHEESREDRPVTKYVAPDFDTFLNHLYELPE
jgi:hypothetical protein